MGHTSVGVRLDRKIDTLERRLAFLEGKEYQNSWDKAEIAALDLALDVLDEHRDTAIRFLRGVD